MRVLPLGRLGREEVAERRAVLRRGLLPVALDRVPALAQPVLIGVAILRDDRSDSLRVARRETEAHRGPVIENIEGITAEAERFRKLLHHVGQVIKGVRKARRARRIRETKSWEVGSDHAVVGRKDGNQVPEHVRRRWKPMQEQDRWSCWRAGLAMENLEAVHILSTV